MRRERVEALQAIAWNEPGTGHRIGLDRQDPAAGHAGPRSAAEPDGAVEVAALGEIDDIGRGLELDLEVAQRDAAPGEARHEPVRGEGRDDAHPEGIAAHRNPCRLRGGTHGVPRRTKLRDVALARCREGETSGQAIKQPDSKMALEDLDPATHRRHRDIEHRRRARQTEGACNDDKGFQRS